MNKLMDLVITKVALVDEGACSDAHIKLYKRKGQGGTVMDFDSIVKALPEEQQTVLKEAVAKAQAEVPEGYVAQTTLDESEGKLKAAEGEITKLKDQMKDAPEGQSAEDILKNADLDPAVRTILTAQIAKTKAAEIAVKEMQDKADQIEFVSKAKEVSFIPEADTKVVELLKSVKGVAGAQDQLMEILKSANTLIEKGQAFSEAGTSNTGSTSTADEAWAKLEKCANELVVKTKVSQARAIEMVMEQQPDLYSEYVQALRAE